ncbi:hypothetical protein CKO28_02665 [Rhodovibrio sodomensis]|uniref:DNA helicase n=1 Tax=Rhodovibrio sodomensis TaxID=1088 RepID=A0ABS1D9A4_9PROT|nr:ATPase domain-containing protein [Rhodovibrio sodomensis]MBK1666945.1 hypothetical protein [Rhodovibrio sodomensis]
MTTRERQVVQMGDHRQRAPRLVDLDLEAQVIGAVLADSKIYRECTELDQSHFSDPVHADLWQSMLDMIEAGKTVTASTLAVDLGPERLDALGGRNVLSSMATNGAGLVHEIGAAAARLREYALWRRIVALSQDIGQWAQNGTMRAEEALSAILRETEMAILSGQNTSLTKRDVARAALKVATEPRQPISTGIEPLDFLLHGGLIPRRMVGIGGQYGRGKTILLGTISDNIAHQGEKHLVILLETPPEDVEIRNCARHLGMNAAQLFDQDDPDYPKFAANAERYADQVPEAAIYEYMPGASMDAIRRMIIRASHRHGIKGFIIDYWQLIRGREKGQSEEAHFREAANDLAALCRQENLWGIVAAQTDQWGKLIVSEGLKHAASLYLRLVREENGDTAYFETEKSNYTRYADGGSAAAPSVRFNYAGPHFATMDGVGLCETAHDAGGDPDLSLD